MSDRLYAKRDHMAQGPHYLRHIDAMTSEGLHAKSAIAAELAHRDMRIEALEAENFTLAAGQCPNVVGDKGGTPQCKEIDALRAKVAALREALETIAAQHSGIIGSAARSDCMAAFALAAIQQHVEVQPPKN